MILRPLLRLFLAFAVALVSTQTALGRLEARGAEQIILCADGHATVIWLGADGRPVERHYPCPDCVTSGLAVLASAAPLARPPERLPRQMAVGDGKALPPFLLWRMAAHARAPPLA